MKIEEKRYIYLSGEEKEYTIIKERIKNIYIKIDNGNIIVKSPHKVPIKEIEKILINKEKWILEKISSNKIKVTKEDKYTLEEFEKIVLYYINKYATKIGVSFNKLRIKKLKYAWGSCTSNKSITINSELMKYDEKTIEYIVVHELSHLKYMNHSKKFWNLVETYIPNYKEIRKTLRT